MNRWRAEATPRHSDALQSVKIDPNACAALVEAPADPAAKFWGRNVPLALEVLGEILGEENPTRQRRAGHAASRQRRYSDHKGGRFSRQESAEGSSESAIFYL